jgi:hypothetical protein
LTKDQGTTEQISEVYLQIDIPEIPVKKKPIVGNTGTSFENTPRLAIFR